MFLDFHKAKRERESSAMTERDYLLLIAAYTWVTKVEGFHKLSH